MLLPMICCSAARFFARGVVRVDNPVTQVRRAGNVHLVDREISEPAAPG
jgi:hypothetical protein